MATSTAEAIRDRVAVLVEALTPTISSADRFRQSLDEGAADFAAWCAANPAGCFRRFQVRSHGMRGLPEVSNMDVARHPLTLQILIAYPHNSRTGGQAARDRDDAMDADFRKIDYAIGIYGRANFSGSHDCTPRGCTSPEPIRGESVDLLVFETSFDYHLDVDG